ncbi:MAG: HlyC/CorC family transporter [Clostridia bacterium]|nr:HlyC/CorC family transporter [Clostridia bacterium]
MREHIVSIVIMLVCLGFSAFFSSTETAYTSFNRAKMKNLAAEGNKKAARALKISENYDKLLSTILVGNNIVNIVLSSLSTVLFIKVLTGTDAAGYATAISTAVTTIVVLLFGEISPKSIAKERPESFAMAVGGVLRVFTVILAPVNAIMMLWKKLLSKIIKPQHDDTVTEGELLTLVDEAHEDGSIDEYNKTVIENIFDFDDIYASDIATHRTDVKLLSVEDSDEDWDEIIMSSRYSRYPICGETVDEIVGILDARKYFRLDDKDRASVMENAVDAPYFVPETVKADVLFKKMKENKAQFAIVLDEHAGFTGIVTLTDLVECLVGEFAEPQDEEEEIQLITQLDEGKWEISGAALLEEIAEAIGVKIDDGESDTFGGFVLGIYGSIPEDGTTFEVSTDDMDIEIMGIKDHKIEKAVVTFKEKSEEQEEAPAEE